LANEYLLKKRKGTFCPLGALEVTYSSLFNAANPIVTGIDSALYLGLNELTIVKLDDWRSNGRYLLVLNENIKSMKPK
jgi:hypothetical protein